MLRGKGGGDAQLMIASRVVEQTPALLSRSNTTLQGLLSCGTAFMGAFGTPEMSSPALGGRRSPGSRTHISGGWPSTCTLKPRWCGQEKAPRGLPKYFFQALV